MVGPPGIHSCHSASSAIIERIVSTSGFLSELPSPQAAQNSSRNFSCASPIFISLQSTLRFRSCGEHFSRHADEGNRAAHATIDAIQSSVHGARFIGREEHGHRRYIVGKSETWRVQYIHEARIHLWSGPGHL